MANDMKTENYAQKIIQHTKKATVDLEVLIDRHTTKKEQIGKGITIHHLRDGSMVVCDYSCNEAPHWYERLPNGWIGEGEAGKKRLAETKGTVWVVQFSPSQFHVFGAAPDADQFYQEQLHLDNRNVFAPARYVDGQRQTHTH